MVKEPSKTVSVTITRPFEDVYAFLADLKNFPAWASGLGKLRRQISAHEWLAESLDGTPSRVRLVPKNEDGIADHYVTLEPEGEDEIEIYVPLRAVAKGKGTDVTLTLFRGKNTSDKQFAADEQHVQKDLAKLKKILEA